MIIFYRICDKGKIPGISNETTISKKDILENFLTIFKNNRIDFFADNCSIELVSYLKSLNLGKVYETALGNAKSFIYMMKIFKSSNIDDDEIILLQEDDYLYLPNSEKIIVEGLSIADYVSLYDHPDKYLNGYNFFVNNGGEIVKVILTNSTHWKLTNSTTMTFAAKAKTLKKDYEILTWSCQFGEIPQDFKMFLKLRNCGRIIATPIPGRATHCDKHFISPIVNWKEYINNFIRKENKNEKITESQ